MNSLKGEHDIRGRENIPFLKNHNSVKNKHFSKLFFLFCRELNKLQEKNIFFTLTWFYGAPYWRQRKKRGYVVAALGVTKIVRSGQKITFLNLNKIGYRMTRAIIFKIFFQFLVMFQS